MKLLIAGLLLVMLELCSCKPFELGGRLGGNVGASMRLKDGVRFGLDGDVDWGLNVGGPASKPGAQQPSAATPAPAPQPINPNPYYDPRSAYVDPRALYDQRPPYGYDQRPPYGYDQRMPYGYDQRPPYGYEQRPPYGY